MCWKFWNAGGSRLAILYDITVCHEGHGAWYIMKHDVRASQGPLDAIFMSRINSLIYTLLHTALEKEIHVWPLLDPPHLPPHQNNPCIDFLLLFQSGALHCHGLAQDLLHQLKLLCPLTQTRRSELVAPWLTNSLIRALVAWVSHHSPPHPPPPFHLHEYSPPSHRKGLHAKRCKCQITTPFLW